MRWTFPEPRAFRTARTSVGDIFPLPRGSSPPMAPAKRLDDLSPSDERGRRFSSPFGRKRRNRSMTPPLRLGPPEADADETAAQRGDLRRFAGNSRSISAAKNGQAEVTSNRRPGRTT